MNRTALCIKMLQLLRGKQSFVSISDLAEMLETNPRNIREYRKELELAGYEIEAQTGKYGGYRLAQRTLLPALSLTEKEKQALQMANQLLKERSEFFYETELLQVTGKLFSQAPLNQALPYTFIQSHQARQDQRIHAMREKLQEAVKQQVAITFSYASLERKHHFKIVKGHPYDLVNVNGSFYVVVYNLEYKQYRNYKVSMERMKDVTLTEQHFERDRFYRLQDYVGEKSIVRQNKQRVTVKIKGKLAVYIAELEVGLDSTSYWEEDNLILTTTFENELACDSFLLSLGLDAVVLNPQEAKDRIFAKLQNMTKLYDQ